jgi:hypothetical protein
VNIAQAPAQYDKTDQDRFRREVDRADGQNVKTTASFLQLRRYAKAALPAQSEGAMIYVTDDTGGAVPAFSDGTNWRRVTDRAVIA